MPQGALMILQFNGEWKKKSFFLAEKILLTDVTIISLLDEFFSIRKSLKWKSLLLPLSWALRFIFRLNNWICMCKLEINFGNWGINEWLPTKLDTRIPETIFARLLSILMFRRQFKVVWCKILHSYPCFMDISTYIVKNFKIYVHFTSFIIM